MLASSLLFNINNRLSVKNYPTERPLVKKDYAVFVRLINKQKR